MIRVTAANAEVLPRVVAALNACRTRAEFLTVRRRLAATVRAGRLAAADLDALGPVLRDAGQRFPDGGADQWPVTR